jgi:hypothetical protein
MNDPNDVFRNRTDSVVIPRIWITIVLSVLIHIATLWELPPVDLRLPGDGEVPEKGPALSLRLVPPGPPAALESPPSRAAAPPPAPRPKPVLRRPAAPPVIALKKPAPDAPSVAPPVTPAAKPAPPPMEGDMASYIEARRRARGESSAAVEDDDARRQRIIAGNLESTRNSTFGYDPSRGGGVFQIERISQDYAEFIFNGWNRDILRNTTQLIEVRKGNNSDIRIAVVRRMIAIIREYKQDDFTWESQRLGRNLMLSARLRDNAGLEDFLMREFFYELRPAQR